MKHLTIESTGPSASKILSNWITTADYIYSSSITVNELKLLLRHELVYKNRNLIVSRLKTRLLNLMKQQLAEELEEDICGIRESNREVLKGED